MSYQLRLSASISIFDRTETSEISILSTPFDFCLWFEVIASSRIMQLHYLAISIIFMANTIAIPTSRASPGFFDEPALLTSMTTCDLLPQNSCFYSFYADDEFAITTMKDENCKDYGQDRIVFNRSSIWFIDIVLGQSKIMSGSFQTSLRWMHQLR